LIALTIVVKVSFGQDAVNLLRNMDNLISAPNDKQGIVEMTLTNKSEKEKVREAIMMQKGKDKKLYTYTKPESQAGIATISLPDDVMWLYMPASGSQRKYRCLPRINPSTEPIFHTKTWTASLTAIATRQPF
jgi:hypothetical protein